MVSYGYSPIIQAKEIVFWVENRDDNTTLDRMRNDQHFKSVSKLLSQTNSDVELRRVVVKEVLEGLVETVPTMMAQGDQIRGLIFQGHGTPEKYILSSKYQYSSQDMGKILVILMRKFQVTPTFSVHFNTCANAFPLKGKKNFQRTLMDEIIEQSKRNIGKTSYGLPTETIHLTAHVYHTNAKKYSSLNKFTWILYNSGMAETVEKLSFQILPAWADNNFIRDSLPGLSSLMYLTHQVVEGSAVNPYIVGAGLGISALFFATRDVKNKVVRLLTILRQDNSIDSVVVGSKKGKKGLFRPIFQQSFQGKCSRLERRRP